MKLALFKWSLAALLAGNAADTASSWQRIELNPALGPRFDARAASLKFGLVGAAVTMQAIAVHRHPEMAKKLAIVDFSMAGAFTGLAIRNAEVKR